MPKSVSTEGWAVSKVVATPSFISITLILCVAVVAFQTLSVHLVPYAGDVGISATASAAALGLMGVLSSRAHYIWSYIRQNWLAKDAGLDIFWDGIILGMVIVFESYMDALLLRFFLRDMSWD